MSDSPNIEAFEFLAVGHQIVKLMDEQLSPIIQPVPVEPQPKNIWQITAIVVAGILVIGGVSYSSYYLWQKSAGNAGQTACTMEAKLCPDGSSVGRVGPNCEFAPCPAEATADWQTYTSAAMGFTFKYPKEYSAPQESKNYLSLISPLNPNRVPKMLELQDGELKIEIVKETARENDSPLKCWNDHSGGVSPLGQSEVTVSGIKTVVLDWEGLGTGQFICINNNGSRYLINKYPAKTTRQSEYDKILSTFKFTDSTADWQMYRNDKYGFEFKYPSKIELTEDKDQVILNHKIPYENHGSCDMKGDNNTYPMLDDFGMSIKVVSSSLVKTVQTGSPYIPKENFLNENLKISPGFIDEYKNNVLNGFSIYEGVEGCGRRQYYFPITENQTLVIANQQIQILSDVIDSSTRNEVLRVPGVISREENERIFDQILSTFKFITR